MANRYLSLLLLLGLLLSGVAFTAKADERSGIDGFVTTSAATPIAGAKIRIDSVTRGSHHEVATNLSGYYLIDGLSPGAYSVCADVAGVGCIIYPHVAITPGVRIRQDFRFSNTKPYPGGCEPHKNK